MGGLTPDEIEAHAAAIRALARRLVGDAHLAEDVAQDTWTVALEAAAPGGMGGEGGAGGERFARWLRGVGRNVSRRAVRTDARRRRREQGAGPGREPLAPDEIVARTELRHRVVAELLRLDEPYRRTILLRFFEGLEPAQIAARDGVPGGTVRSRLKRALDLLRARLDAAHDGHRAAWLLPLAAGLRAPVPPAVASSCGGPAAARASVATLGLGVVAMTWKAVAATVALVVLAGAAWLVMPDGGAPHPGAVGGPGAPAAAASRDPQRVHVVPEQGAAPAAVEDAPQPDVSAPAELQVTGRVLGDGRHPVPDVQVALVTRSSATVYAVTDADGRYRLPTSVADGRTDPLVGLGMIHARAPGGRAAAQAAYLATARDGTLVVPTLILGPARELLVRVEDGDGPVADADVSLSLASRLALLRTGAEGVVRFAGVPDSEPVVVQAVHGERGRAHARVVVDTVRQPLVLTLTRRDVTVRTVRAGSGASVPDVPLRVSFTISIGDLAYTTVHDPPLTATATGPDGTVLLTVGADERLSVAALTAAASSPLYRFVPHAVVRPGETDALLELPAAHTFRWRIVPGDVPSPVEGDVLVLLERAGSGRSPPPGTAIVRDAHVVIADVPVESVSCLARTPDGRMALLYAAADDAPPREITFRRERAIDVVLRRADGSPAAGVWVIARSQGNNPLRPAARTDADGALRIAPLYGRLADVNVIESPAKPWGGVRVGTVDLEQGDGRLELTLPARSRVTLEVTCDGVPALPTRYALSGGVSVLREDPVGGLLVIDYPSPAPGTPLRAWFRAAGYQAQSLALPAAGADTPLALDLRAGATLRGAVLPAADGRAGVVVQRRDAASDRWTSVNLGSSPAIGPTGPDGAVLGRDLPPGRYRLRDRSTGLATAAVDVAAGGVADLGVLDLSRAGAVAGTIEVPEGASARGARIVVESDALEPVPAGIDNPSGAVRADGRFSVRVPGDRVVTLRALHPTLRSGAAAVLDVREPRTGVVLRLERGPVLRVRAQEAIEVRLGGPPRALYFEQDEARGRPVFERTCMIVDGGLEVGTPGPGRYTLWIDAAPWAPLIVRGVEVGTADVDLGEREFPAGSAVRVRVLVEEGQAAPRLSVWAQADGAPGYSRGLNSGGETEVVLRGLGPGRFTVTSLPIMGGLPPTRVLHEIEVDGSEASVHEIELDLR